MDGQMAPAVGLFFTLKLKTRKILHQLPLEHPYMINYPLKKNNPPPQKKISKIQHI